jgi:FkbM family methyltransferase
MKNSVIIRNDGWVWPLIDQASWDGQQVSINLVNHIIPHVKEKNIMVQAGGNCGLLLSTFVSHFKTIYTFEPDPVNFYCLNQNVTSPNVIKMQGCLGNDTTPVNVQHLDRINRLHDIGGVHISGSGLTPVFKIDDLNLPGCDLIQLDIEGYELEAILGAMKTIEKYKPVLCVEFMDRWLHRYGASSSKLLEILTTLNYQHVFDYGVDKIFIPK